MEQSATNPSPILYLPQDLLHSIQQFLDYKTWYLCLTLNKKWYNSCPEMERKRKICTYQPVIDYRERLASRDVNHWVSDNPGHVAVFGKANSGKTSHIDWICKHILVGDVYYFTGDTLENLSRTIPDLSHYKQVFTEQTVPQIATFVSNQSRGIRDVRRYIVIDDVKCNSPLSFFRSDVGSNLLLNGKQENIHIIATAAGIAWIDFAFRPNFDTLLFTSIPSEREMNLLPKVTGFNIKEIAKACCISNGCMVMTRTDKAGEHDVYNLHCHKIPIKVVDKS